MNGDGVEAVRRLVEDARRTIESGGTVPDGAAAAYFATRFVESADEDGLMGALEALSGATDDADTDVADVVEGLRFLGLEDQADQLAAGWNWLEDGMPVDEEAGVKARDVLYALDQRFSDAVDAERLEEAVAERLAESPEAFGR